MVWDSCDLPHDWLFSIQSHAVYVLRVPLLSPIEKETRRPRADWLKFLLKTSLKKKSRTQYDETRSHDWRKDYAFDWLGEVF